MFGSTVHRPACPSLTLLDCHRILLVPVPSTILLLPVSLSLASRSLSLRLPLANASFGLGLRACSLCIFSLQELRPQFSCLGSCKLYTLVRKNIWHVMLQACREGSYKSLVSSWKACHIFFMIWALSMSAWAGERHTEISGTWLLTHSRAMQWSASGARTTAAGL